MGKTERKGAGVPVCEYCGGHPHRRVCLAEDMWAEDHRYCLARLEQEAKGVTDGQDQEGQATP